MPCRNCAFEILQVNLGDTLPRVRLLPCSIPARWLECLLKSAQLQATQAMKFATWTPSGESLSFLVFAGPIVPAFRASTLSCVHIACLIVRAAAAFFLATCRGRITVHKRPALLLC